MSEANEVNEASGTVTPEQVQASNVKERPHTDAKTFLAAVVEVHSAGGSKQDVATKLGLALTSVEQRLAKYKKAGVKVPQFKRAGGARLDVNAANELIASLSAPTTPPQTEAAPPAEAPAQ